MIVWLAGSLLFIAGGLAGLLVGRRLGARAGPARQLRGPGPEENGQETNGAGASADHPELSWVLRANQALGGWLRAGGAATVEVETSDLPRTVREAVAQRLAVLHQPKETRAGVERLDEGVLVFVAAEDLSVALLLGPGQPTGRPLRDLEALAAVLRARAALDLPGRGRPPGRAESVSSLAIRLALQMERLLDAEVAVAVRRPQGAQVMGTALRADPHLHRVAATPGSPVDLMVRGELEGPAIAFEPLGLLTWDRRHRERKAFLYPIRGGAGPVAVLVAWTRGGAEPVGPVRGDLEREAQRVGPLLEDAVQRMELVEQATHDVLTGLDNRRGLEAAMGAVNLDRGALICLDLDHFKTLNDALGHPAGDAALGFVARIIRETIRDRDKGARIGGEEFAVWLPGVDLKEAQRVAERLRTRLAGRAWGWNGKPWPLTASFGVAAWPGSTRSRENLLQLADRALYRAKELGRNRVESWEPEA